MDRRETVCQRFDAGKIGGEIAVTNWKFVNERAHLESRSRLARDETIMIESFFSLSPFEILEKSSLDIIDIKYIGFSNLV